MAVASIRMIRVPDKLDEIIQANKTGQLWSMSAKELLLVCTQLKARSALEIQAVVRGQYQVALMLRRRRFIDDLRALGREVFPREFVIRGLGGMVRSPKPAPRGTQGVTVGDYSFGGLDFRYKSAQGGPTDEQAEQSVAPEMGKKGGVRGPLKRAVPVTTGRTSGSAERRGFQGQRGGASGATLQQPIV